MPWWRVRSWGKDLDTLTRLHRGLQALDAEADAEQEPLSAPVLLAPPGRAGGPAGPVAEESVAEQSVARRS